MSLYLGLMSGTSSDAIDAALLERNGEVLSLRGTLAMPMPSHLKERIMTLVKGKQWSRTLFGEVNVEVAHAFADCTLALLDQENIKTKQVAAIGSHGQTLFHQPNGPLAYSVQIGDPSVLARLTGITTVADFRQKDIAFGGQGAPLVPIFHQAIFPVHAGMRWVLNLGGIANLTGLTPEGICLGFDCGPANTLLDAWVRRHLDQDSDEGGQWAASGYTHVGLLERLLNDSFFKQAPPKSTGLDYFNLDWLAPHFEGFPKLKPEDVASTLLTLTLESTALAIEQYSPEPVVDCVVCGGGIHNRFFMENLQSRLSPIEVKSSSALGYDPDFVEAMAFAYLAEQTLVKRSGNVPQVTGASRAVVLGGVYAAD